MNPRRARYLVPLVIVLLLSAFQYQQRRWGTGWMPNPLREGLPTASNGTRDRGFTFCRLLYEGVRREQGGYSWNTDYPGSDYNFIRRFAELTTAKPARWADGQPGNAVVRPTQEELYECPFIFMSDVGTVGFSELEVVRLRDYLMKGGFIGWTTSGGSEPGGNGRPRSAVCCPTTPLSTSRPTIC